MLGRTKLQGVTSESLFKDMIAGHARDLANSQTYSLENGGEVSLTLSYMIAGHARDLANSQTYSLENGGEVSLTLCYDSWSRPGPRQRCSVSLTLVVS